jgi:hypothetical protein
MKPSWGCCAGSAFGLLLVIAVLIPVIFQLRSMPFQGAVLKTAADGNVEAGDF